MRALLIGTSAILLAAAGCDRNQSDKEAPVNEPNAGERAEEAAAQAGDALEDAGEAVVHGIEEAAEAVGDAVEREVDQFDARGLTVRNILGTVVKTRNGVVAARMDDLLFSAAGEPQLAVMKEGGIFGVGDDEIVVTIQRLTIKQDAAGEVAVGVTLTDEEIETLGEGVAFLPTDFSVAGEFDPSLLSAKKLNEVSVYNSDQQKVADVYDLILGPEWKIERVILSTGGLADVGDRLVDWDWSKLEFNDDRTALYTKNAMRDFDSLPAFHYEDLVSPTQ